MNFREKNLYHIYNQGNNKEPVFLDKKDYLLFVDMTRALIRPNCDLLAYCLMPNHFHFLIRATNRSTEQVQLGSIRINLLSNAFRLLLSLFARDHNLKYMRTGSLFRQKTKAKCLDDSDAGYALDCFLYIHQNPVKAGLVDDPEDWPYSSLKSYLHAEPNALCDQDLATALLEISSDELKTVCRDWVSERRAKNLYKIPK